ncbi:MAG: hypothetical protein AAF708_05895 [Deinococcota bacterium]
MPNPQRVDNLEAAKILTDTRQLKLLEPFFQTEVVLAEVAERLNLKLNTLLYKVNKWLELDIVQVVREEARNGRASKVYHSTATAFFVPFDATTSTDLNSFVYNLTKRDEARFYENVTRALQAKGSDYGVLINLNEHDHLMLQSTTESNLGSDIKQLIQSDAAALFGRSGVLRLEFATAKALQADMQALFEKYSAQNTPNAQAYAYRLGITPVTDDSL